MKKYVGLAMAGLILLGCAGGPAKPVVKPPETPKEHVVVACRALDQLDSYYFDLQAIIGVDAAGMGMSVSLKPKGFWKNPDFCYFKMDSPEGMLGGGRRTDGEMELYRQGDKIMGGHGKKNEAKKWTEGAQGSPLGKGAIVNQIFTPFYRTADLDKFLSDARFAADEKVGETDCWVVLVPVPPESLKDALHLEDMLKDMGMGLPGKMELVWATYKFWVGKTDYQVYQARRLVEYKMIPPEKDDESERPPMPMPPVTFKLEINMTIYDRNKPLDIQVPEAVKTGLSLF